MSQIIHENPGKGQVRRKGKASMLLISTKSVCLVLRLQLELVRELSLTTNRGLSFADADVGQE